MTVPASCVLADVLAAIASVGCGTETLDFTGRERRARDGAVPGAVLGAGK